MADRDGRGPGGWESWVGRWGKGDFFDDCQAGSEPYRGVAAGVGLISSGGQGRPLL